MEKEILIATNKKAYHDYELSDEIEVGIVLTGTEIKSVRESKVSLKEAYCYIEKGELFIDSMHIAKYEKGNIYNHDEKRTRKLLAHKSEILKLLNKVKSKGYTIVPLKMYIVRGRAKLLIALGRGKKLYDKRKDIQEKDVKRDLENALRR